MGEYGEPWNVQTVICPTEEAEDGLYSGCRREHEIITSEGDSILVVADDADVDYRFRALACVNALDGVPDEAMPMVAKLVELARTKSDKLAEAYRDLMMAMAADATKEVPND